METLTILYEVKVVWEVDRMEVIVQTIFIRCCAVQVAPFQFKQRSLLPLINDLRLTRHSTYSWKTEVDMARRLVRVRMLSLKMQSTQLELGILDQGYVLFRVYYCSLCILGSSQSHHSTFSSSRFASSKRSSFATSHQQHSIAHIQRT